MSTKTCQSCKFWDQTEVKIETGEDTQGECCRYPPTLLDAALYQNEAWPDSHSGFWPVTYNTDWCGEWQEKQA